MENKARFVADLNAALVRNGSGRYDHLVENPLTYMASFDEETGNVSAEYVRHGDHMVNVTGSSLTGILGDLYRARVI